MDVLQQPEVWVRTFVSLQLKLPGHKSPEVIAAYREFVRFPCPTLQDQQGTRSIEAVMKSSESPPVVDHCALTLCSKFVCNGNGNLPRFVMLAARTLVKH